MPDRRRFAIVISLAALVLLAGCARTPQEKYARFLQRGKKLLQESKPERAVVEFRSAMQQQPKAPEGYYWVAQAFLAQDRVADAVVALRKATELKPGYAPAQLKLAELMVRSRDEQLLKDAETRIQKVLTDNPGDDDALVTLAAAEAQLGKMGDSEKYLKEALNKSPGNLRPKIALALVKATENDLAGAEELMKATALLAPSSDDVLVALGHLDAGLGRTAEAAAMFQKAIGINANNTDAWISLGSLQLTGGDVKAAEQSFKRAAESPKTQAPLAYVVFLIRQNRRVEAIRNLERMFKATPENRVVRTALVAGYITANRQREAEDILNAAIKKNPNDLEALLQQSQIYIRKRRLKEALADLYVALTVSPTSPQAHFLRSKIYSMKGDEAKRREDLVATLRMAPDSLPARIDLADALLQTNKAQEALAVLNQATGEQKRSLAFVVAYNWALIGMGDLATARKDVDRSLGVFKSPQFLLQDAVLKMTAHDYSGARRSLDQVVSETPDETRAINLLMDTYIAQNQRSAATERLRQLAQANPRSLAVQMAWIRWLIGENQLVDARKALAETATANPTSTEPLLVSAALDFNSGQLAGARSTLRSLFRLDDQVTQAYQLAGQVEEASGNYGEAISFYRKVLTIDAINVFALNNLAYVLSRDSKHMEEALDMVRRAKEQAPESPEVLDTFGWLCYRKGEYDVAVKELEHALAKAELPAIEFHLGMTYNRLGESEKGGRLIASALAKDPKLVDSEALH